MDEINVTLLSLIESSNGGEFRLLSLFSSSLCQLFWVKGFKVSCDLGDELIMLVLRDGGDENE